MVGKNVFGGCHYERGGVNNSVCGGVGVLFYLFLALLGSEKEVEG